jgi:hypothetical protein
MLKKDVLVYFDPEKGRPGITAKALGLTPGAISSWKDTIPELTARRIAALTQGKLPFRPEMYGQVA